MAQAKHTPGPWQAREAEGGEWEVVQHDATKPTPDEPWYIALAHDAANEGDTEANARLIAAAPDLLVAAQRALNFIENTEGEIGDTLESGDLLRAAIAKATAA